MRRSSELALSSGPPVAMPDLSAFETDNIEKSKRQKRLSGSQPPFASGTPGGVIPVSLSSSQGRPVCPSTPMKSPSMSKLFHQQNNHHHTYTPQSLNNSHGRGGSETSFASSLNSSRGSESELGLSGGFGTPASSAEFESQSHTHHHHQTNSPAPPISAMKRLSHMPPPNSLASSLGRPSSRFANSFCNFGEIGRGDFGAVFHVSDIENGGKEYAVKKSLKVFRGENDRAVRRREVENLRKIRTAADAAPGHTTVQPTPAQPAPPVPSEHDHEHLVKFIQDWEEHGSLYIQTELLHGGTVAQYLTSFNGPPPSEMLWLFLLDLCRGLRFLHDRVDLVHLDLKWENTFISPGEEDHGGILKIGDFGRSLDLHEIRTRFKAGTKKHNSTHTTIQQQPPVSHHQPSNPTFHPHPPHSSFQPLSLDDFNDETLCLSLPPSSHVPEVEEGDRRYMAPEFFETDLLGPDETISSSADIFSLGIMMIEAASGEGMPGNGPTWTELRQTNFQAIERWKEIQPEMQAIITRMCARCPKDRPTAAEILTTPQLVALACNGGGAAREALKNMPSVLPTSRRLNPSAGLLLDSCGLPIEVGWSSLSGGGGGLFDTTMTPIPYNSSSTGLSPAGGGCGGGGGGISPLLPFGNMGLGSSGRTRNHQSTPTSLAHALSQCAPSTGGSSGVSSVDSSFAVGSNLHTPADHLSSSLFSSSSYSSRSGSGGSSVSSSNTSITHDMDLSDQNDEDRLFALQRAEWERSTWAAQQAHLAQQAQAAAAAAPSHRDLLNIRELSKSTRRTVSSHTARHAVKGIHSSHLAMRFAPLPAPFTAPHGLAHAPTHPHTPHTPNANPSAGGAIRQASILLDDFESEPEESMPARNLFAAFAEADEE